MTLPELHRLTIFQPFNPRRFFLALFFLCLLFAKPRGAPAQDDFFGALRPEMGKSQTRLSYSYTGYPGQDVAGQGKDLALNQHGLSLSHPITQGSNHEWVLTGNLRYSKVRTDALLPDSRDSFPSELWDIHGGALYRHKFQNDWIGGAFLTVGSASDQPFASDDELTINANLFARIPHEGRNAWLLFLNYANNREFWPHVPIPGVGYSYEPSEAYRLIIGIPFLSAQLRPAEDLSIDLSYLAVRNVQARLSYRFGKSFRGYGGFAWRNERYFRADRSDRNDRLFYYEKRLFVGLQWSLGRLTMDASGGFAFDRFYFESEKYENRDPNRVNVGNGPYGSLRIGLRF
jgi:hypothetical protein